jgi:hypothetical protein
VQSGQIYRENSMKLPKIFATALLGGGLLAVTATAASSAIVCSRNTCWHSHDRYRYPPEAGIVVHRDNWRGGPGIVFREHEGRGYWRGDDWVAW